MHDVLVTPQKDEKVYLNTALNIGKYLAKEAIWYNDMCNWTGHEVCTINQNYVNAVKACGIELYSGLSGIGVFFSELYTKTNDPIILHTLNGILSSIEYNLKSNQLNNYGYYSGKIGVGYTLWKIGKQLERDELILKGISIIKSVKSEQITEHEIDIISGAAGSISVLLKLFYAEKDHDFLALAVKCGNFLLEKGIKENEFWSWKTVDPTWALTGYSHGASGIASALLELYATTKDENYWHASMGGFQYEKKWFSEQAQNWPDLRQYTGSGNLNYGTMWCHGAPGIAIAYLKAYEMTKNEFFLSEAKIALNTTLKSVIKETEANSNANFSLCHGLAGNADILLYASDILDDTSYRNVAEKAGSIGVQLYDATNTVYPSGVNDPSGQTSGQQENPGLMLGLSGTGLFYLRLDNSKDIPSALVP